MGGRAPARGHGSRERERKEGTGTAHGTLLGVFGPSASAGALETVAVTVVVVGRGPGARSPVLDRNVPILDAVLEARVVVGRLGEAGGRSRRRRRRLLHDRRGTADDGGGARRDTSLPAKLWQSWAFELINYAKILAFSTPWTSY